MSTDQTKTSVVEARMFVTDLAGSLYTANLD
jgi:hypothetical protein